jgi:hypothetical protein
MRRNDFVPIDVEALKVGAPLPWSVYDKTGILLLAEGSILQSKYQLERLRFAGMAYRSDLKASRPMLPNTVSDFPEQTPPLARSVLFPAKVGDLIQARMPPDAEEFSLRYIGQVPNRSLLVSHPERGGSLIAVRDGQTVMLRGFSGTDIYKAQTRIIRVCLTPFPYLHLKTPSSVVLSRIRKDARATINLPAVLYVGDTTHNGRILDLSVQGCRVECSRCVLEVGNEVVLGFRVVLEQESLTLTLTAMVRSEASGDNSNSYGLQFVDTTLFDKLALRALSCPRE